MLLQKLKKLKIMMAIVLFAFLNPNVWSCGFSYCPGPYSPCMTYGGDCHSTEIQNIDPENDNQSNTAILIEEINHLTTAEKADFQKNNPYYDEGDSDPTLFKEKLDNFELILKEADVSLSEKEKFLIWRKNLLQDKVNGKIEINIKDFEKSEARDFSEGLVSFYSKQSEACFQKFMDVSNSNKPFIKEYSLYLASRCAGRMAQEQWDGYVDDVTKLNKEWLETYKNSLKNYISQFPNGKYVASAINLERRVEWLKQNKTGYFELLNRDLENLNSKELLRFEKIQTMYSMLMEYGINSKYVENFHLTTKIHPLFWPLYLAKLFRPIEKDYFNGLDDEPKVVIDYAKLSEILNNSEKDFTNYKYEWVLSRGLIDLKLKKFSNIEALINQSGLSEYSILTLKARALMEMKRFIEARKILSSIHNERLLFLSYYYEGKLSNAFLKNSPLLITTENAKSYATDAIKVLSLNDLITLLNGGQCNPLIKDYLSELFIRKSLMQNDFKSISNLKSTTYKKQIESAKSILKGNQIIESKLDLSDFLGQSTIMAWEYRSCKPSEQMVDFDAKKSKFKLPINYMVEALNALDSKKKYPFEAKLLSTLIKCFRTTNDINCNLGLDLNNESSLKLDINKRKMWFRKLQSKYPDSQFALDTPYYF